MAGADGVEGGSQSHFSGEQVEYALCIFDMCHQLVEESCVGIGQGDLKGQGEVLMHETINMFRDHYLKDKDTLDETSIRDYFHKYISEKYPVPKEQEYLCVRIDEQLEMCMRLMYGQKYYATS